MKILVGAGSDAPAWSAQGWACNDIAEAAALHPGITLVGPCWAIPVENASVDEIMARGMLEHLTYREVVQSFQEWRRIIKIGGHFTVEVPDVEEYLREYFIMRRDPSQWRGEGADGCVEEPDDHDACDGIDRWLRRALWGWQRWPGDEHRSGWTQPMLEVYLKKYFSERYDIRRMTHSYDEDMPEGPRSRKAEGGRADHIRHLWARAWKV